MGKKTKIGKARKDKFYKLAKETGYRARSAFKLLQLNRKYEFLQKSRVLVDLCAAPGGWLQVAANHMPVSSIIVGVDLVPIRPIHNVTTLMEDITTESCRQSLKKELRDWKVDVFLNDGAPNIGKNWIFDAYQQAELTLSALKLALSFLKKGGWFISKVFRSKDYTSLMWVFNQLFGHVHATKPQASRNESAEIFVVCQGFLAPHKIDPKFTDPKFVFKEIHMDPKPALNLMHPEKRVKKADGYAEGDYTLHHKLNVSEFLTATNFQDLLAEAHEIVFDDDEIRNNSRTTLELIECCKDIKLLGKREIRKLLEWRKKINKERQKLTEKPPMDVESASEDEEAKIATQVSEIKAQQLHELKKKKKKVMKDKRKLRDQMEYKMIIPGDNIDTTDDIALFDLHQIKNKKQLKEVETGEQSEESEAESEDLPRIRKQKIAYDRYGEDVKPGDSDDGSDLEFESEESEKSDEEPEDETVEPEDENPLLMTLEDRATAAKQQTDVWFNREIFSEFAPENNESDLLIRKNKVLPIGIDKKSSRKRKTLTESNTDNIRNSVGMSNGSSLDSLEEDVDSDDLKSEHSDSDDSGYDINDALPETGSAKKVKHDKGGFDVVPQNTTAGKIVRLDPLGLAIGAEIIKSKKRRREIIEDSFHRYTSNDDNLPDWFVKDERKHSRKQLPVTKEQIQVYKDLKKNIDARPIKKIAEAKARKKKKSLKKLERARKKADAVSDTVDVSDKEKAQQIKQIYKKAGLLKKQQEQITYVVARKGTGKRVQRPAGVKGRFKVVDPRMKKDNMKKAKASKAKGAKSKGKSKPRKRT